MAILLLGLFIAAVGSYFILTGFILMEKQDNNPFKALNHKKNPLRFFYPGVWLILHRLQPYGSLERQEKTKEQLKALHFGEDGNWLYWEFILHRGAMAAIIILLFSCIGIFIAIREEGQGNVERGRYIRRPAYGEGENQISLKARIEDKDGGMTKDITLTIGEQLYNQEEWEAAVSQAKKYIETAVLGDNSSLDAVIYPLRLIKSIPGTSIQVKWDTGMDGPIGEDGSLYQERIGEEGCAAVLTAIFCYQEKEVAYDLPLRIMPYIPKKEEILSKALRQAIEKEEQESKDQALMQLPERAGQFSIYFWEEKRNFAGIFFILGLTAAVAAGLAPGKNLEKQIKRREVQMLSDYPELINKFTLLLGAGMTIKRAWERIVLEYEDKKERKQTGLRYAYEEMAVTKKQLENGVTERVAFDAFGKRAGILPYMKWSSLLGQNTRKGSKDLLEILELEAMDAFEQRKELAKRLGEEAGTKLLVPMMLMLFIVLGIVMIPAILSFTI